MAAVSVPEGRYLRVNKAFCDILGRGMDEVTGSAWDAAVHPDDVEPTTQAVAAIALEGAEDRSVEVRYVRPDGSVCWVLVVFSVVPDPASGEPLYMFAQFLDITRRKMLELAERLDAADRLAEVEDVAGIGRFEFDARTGTMIWSDILFTQFGLEPGAFQPDFDPFLDRVHPDDRHLVLRSMQKPDPFNFELRLLQPDGSFRWAEARGRPTFEGGALVRVVGLSVDITQRKASEEAMELALQRARELSRSKDTFLTAISHELRTPMTSIVGFIDLLRARHDQLSAEQRGDYLERAGQNVRELQRMLGELLDVDRLARGVMQPLRKTFDMADVAAKALARSGLGETHAVRADLAEVMVELDPAWVERILDQLLSNAAKHTPPGSAVLVATKMVDDDVHIHVDDEGPGVPAGVREAIFEPFGHGPTASEHSPGMAVGLALVRYLSELQGGRVVVEDGERGGARFCVRLPRFPA